MFVRPIQIKTINEGRKTTQNNDKVRSKKAPMWQNLRNRGREYLVLFLETSSIHGLNHLIAARRHPCEIFLWLIIVVLSVFGSVYLSQTTWARYQSSPTVVSMDRDMFAWNTTFPCVTVCNDHKINLERLEEFVKNSEIDDKEGLKRFIIALGNATYKNFETLPMFDQVKPSEHIDILVELSSGFKPSLTIGALGRDLEITPTITEMGLCYAINSKIAVYNSPAYIKANRWDIITTQNSSITVHPLDGEVFAHVLNLSSSYDVYIHGPLEVPDISTKFEHSPDMFYMKLYVTAFTVYTSPEAARLTIGQRRCRFTHENNLKHFAVYSYTNCQMECRAQLCLKYCDCLPYFYRRIGDEKNCDVRGLHCLAKHKDELYKLRDKAGKKINCGCLPICNDVNYVIQSNDLQEWFLGTNLQWGMVTYPRMRYRRDIIFGFTDVLVAVGGMAGLFLGCSVLSFMEIIYFLSLRLFCYSRSAMRK
ncbi:sodium channel protein Nach-like [Zerene cesonia]|uniref:sodium channel protein Nach-like n=1 Tax=Zerene cesonia TaxID=33412 RepID=UPI0018E502AB|nr:sodium channel protein Nach-like [Zerene cesonia]